MALILADRVQETSTSPGGTGTLNLSGTAPAGFKTFSSGIGTGNSTYYCIFDTTLYSWEVGIGTYTSGTPGTLSRTTVLSNSAGTTALVNFTNGNTLNIFCTYPSEKSVNLDSSGNVSALGTISSGTWQGTTVGVAYGGTGVTASSGANSVVLRDANQNIAVNSVTQNLTKTTSAAGTTTLTLASSHFQILTGTTTQTYKLPDATSLPVGTIYVFDNDSTGNLTVQDNALGTVDVVAPGGYSTVFLEANGTVAGEWGRFGMIPNEVNWGTNSLALGGSTIVSGGTWQGNPIAYNYGGTGLTTFTAANYALYSTSASALTAGTLPVAAGGTGATTLTANGVVYGNGTSAVGITAAGTTGQVLVGNTGAAPSWATVSSTLVSSFSGGTTGLTPSTATTGAVTLAGTLVVANGGTGSTTSSGARTNLGATTLGGNLFTITNPSAVTFPRFNADNTVSALDAATFRTAIGAGTGSGSVTSVSGTGTVNGITLTGTVTSSGSLTLGGTLSGVSLTSQVSDTLPIGNGGTGQTTASAAFNALSPITSTGDLIVGNGANSATRLAIGTNGQVLSSNGTTATWTTLASSGLLTGTIVASNAATTPLTAPNYVATGANYTRTTYPTLAALYPNPAASNADGTTWVSGTMPTTTMPTYGSMTSAFNGTTYVVVNGSTKYFTSTDGVSWTSRTLATLVGQVAWNGSVFVAMQPSALSSNTYYTSADGVTWTSRTFPVTAAFSLAAKTTATAIFVIVPAASSATAYSSTDGITWTSRTLPATQTWPYVFYYPLAGLFVATSGAGTTAATSPDGITWTSRTFVVAGLQGLGTVGTTNVAVNTAANLFYTSADCITWTAQAAPPATPISYFAATNGYAYYSYQNRIYRSTTAATWTQIYGNPSDTAGTSYPAKLFGCQNANRLFTSTSGYTTQSATTTDNGVTWVTTGLPSSAGHADWSAVVNNSSTWVALASGTATNQNVATSPDGITWTLRTSAIPCAVWSSIAWNGTIFCAMQGASPTQLLLTGNINVTTGYAVTNQCMTSPDGITWTARTLPASLRWTGIASNGSIFVATHAGDYTTATAAGTATTCYTSSDGITWTSRTIPVAGSWYNVAWNGSVFCAVGYNSTGVAVATSPDGITWTARTSTIAVGSSIIGLVGFSSGFAITTGAGMYISNDNGVTWYAPSGAASYYYNVHMASNGQNFEMNGASTTATNMSFTGTVNSTASLQSNYINISAMGATSTSTSTQYLSLPSIAGNGNYYYSNGTLNATQFTVPLATIAGATTYIKT